MHAWDAGAFDELLAAVSVDKAWTLLSPTAESLLLLGSSTDLCRAASWSPVPSAPGSAAAKGRETGSYNGGDVRPPCSTSLVSR